jgi:SpoVK/Ycf46/Vps4 family AAA+-type ATPase
MNPAYKPMLATLVDEPFDGWTGLGGERSSMATAHLLHGYIGVGKTTLARRLEDELSAVRFTLENG